MSNKTLGQIGFDAYGDRAEWKAFDGRPMPVWDEALRADIKDKWEVAADAIVKHQADVKAEAVVAAVLANITDRRCLRQAWDSIDADIKAEIRETLANIVRGALIAP